MTNGEKFIEVFGLEPNEHFCPLSEEIGCGSCPYSKNGCDEVHKDRFFSMEYKEPITKNDLGVDAVSRQAVLDLIADYDLSMGQVVKGIHALPSVTPQEPKTGHWIDDEFGSKCSCCGIHTHLNKFDRPMKFKYCSMCGAKMVEPQEREEQK